MLDEDKVLKGSMKINVDSFFISPRNLPHPLAFLFCPVHNEARARTPGAVRLEFLK